MFGRNEARQRVSDQFGAVQVHEIFYTIQGEGTEVGMAAVFIRFSACNLACTWCDTERRG